jgi:hypothetical protein
MDKLNLRNVTLFCYENRKDNIDKAIEAIEICKYYADFGDINFVTNQNINYEHCIVDDFPIKSLFDYSKFILTKLNYYVQDEFVLTIHDDGFITNPEAFDSKLFKIDYCGAPLYRMNKVVGNGGFSWRSKKLLNLVEGIVNFLGYPSKELYADHEDIVICFLLRGYLMEQGCVFADFETADKFSVETKGKWSGEFGWHGRNFIDLEKDGWINPLKNKE